MRFKSFLFSPSALAGGAGIELVEMSQAVEKRSAPSASTTPNSLKSFYYYL